MLVFIGILSVLYIAPYDKVIKMKTALQWTPHRITSSLGLFSFFPSFSTSGYNVGMYLKFCEDYIGVHKIIFHNYVSEFMKKKYPFSRSVESWHAYPYSTWSSSQKFPFLGMPPDCTFFKSKNEKSSLPWGGGDTPPLRQPQHPQIRTGYIRGFTILQQGVHLNVF